MMKQNKLITLIVLTITVICSSLPLQGQTKLYNQYKHRTDMVVMCVMDFPITDSITVDITLFQPLTPDHLWPMVQEFNVINLEKDTVNYYYSNDKYAPLHFYNVEKDNIKRFYGPIRNPDNDYVNMSKLVYNYNTGTIMVFHNIETEERCDILDRFLIKALKQPELLPKTNEYK
ncbi:MAG: hypothetical protein J6V54_08200 [Bacteroidales bacterium]|nr:hypothetical protein [Bacteroidales bacterium]